MPRLEGMPIGIEPGVEYGRTEFLLSPGDAVLFLTDGVTEAENETGELFGHDRLENYVGTDSAPPRATGLLEKINSWRGNAERNDDLTVVEIWRDRLMC